MAALVTCMIAVLAQPLPYNPTYLIQGQNSKIYQLSPDASPQFSVYDVTNTLSKDDAAEPLTTQLPFLSDGSNSFIPVAMRGGITVFSGGCSAGERGLDLWTYGFGVNNQTWRQMHATSLGPSLSATFLAAAFKFPSSQTPASDDLYVFGGMCPNGAGNASAWTADAAYLNTLLAITREQGKEYEVSLTGTRSPPIAEAGLTITPLLPTAFKPDDTAAQQRFVLVGGHTKNAFISMSRVAMFSMPEQAWAFLGIEQPSDTAVEPRSGHTSVMSEDGSRIFVFGGWVGDVTNPATPQLAILDVGQGYGGNGSWAWTAPDVKDQYFGGANGVYGHAAIMLPGDVMMVTGGYSITGKAGSKVKRDTMSKMFYNTSSASWSDDYINPNAVAGIEASQSGLSPTEKAGLGAGLGVGIASMAAIAVVWLLYARRKRQQRKLQGKHLRELALGIHDTFSTTDISRPGSRGDFLGCRSPNWGAGQEGITEVNDKFYSSIYPPAYGSGDLSCRLTAPWDTMNILHPHRNLRHSLREKAQPGLSSYNCSDLIARSAVFTIEEMEERSEQGSVQRRKTAESGPRSDPFRNPPNNQPNDEAAATRKQEVQTWVDHWRSAAESMNLSPSACKVDRRTCSNPSVYHSASRGEISSDRMNSDLSEQSNPSDLSYQKSNVGTVSRTISQRGGSAGYALFSSAAAAIGRITGRQDHTNINKTAGKRSVSYGDVAQMAATTRCNSVEQNNQPSNLTTPYSREELNDYKNHRRKWSNSFASHPNGRTIQSKKALGVLGQGAKRNFTGTGTVNVPAKVDAIKRRYRNDSPIKGSGSLDMAEVTPRRVSSSGAAYWRQRQGAKDWADPHIERPGTVRRRSGRPQIETEGGDSSRNEDDWDVETAVQQRVVQVMFTVPKEKLRVVNVDNLSMVSRTDTNASRDSNTSDEGKDTKRMSRVTEDGEDYSTTISSAPRPKTSLHPSSAAV